VHDACSGVESRVGVHIRGRKVSVERTRWKALRVQMGPPLTGWSSKHPGCAGELEADAQACVSTATGRCNGADTVVPAERHGASEIGSDPGKAPPAREGAGGRHRKPRCLYRRKRRVRCGERGASGRINRSGRKRIAASSPHSPPRERRGVVSEAILTQSKVPGIVASDTRGFGQRPRAAAET
jgi:hypothetical protein